MKIVEEWLWLGYYNIAWLWTSAVQRIHQVQGPDLGFSRKKVELFVFRIFKLIARFSKHDFWNLGEISDRYRKKSIKK